jgi:large subunit ribosomal protein L4
MKVAVISLDNSAAGDLELNDSVFGASPRPDILKQVVRWQLARRQRGTHNTKGISEISGTGARPYRQKGSGRARQGSRRSPQFRGGAVIFGPKPRGHAFDLNKKVRTLGLRLALSDKRREGQLVILDEAVLKDAKTASLAKLVAAHGWSSALVIGGAQTDGNFTRAARNLRGLDVLPLQGANVYDILRREVLVLTRDAVSGLEARLA